MPKIAEAPAEKTAQTSAQMSPEKGPEKSGEGGGRSGERSVAKTVGNDDKTAAKDVDKVGVKVTPKDANKTYWPRKQISQDVIEKEIVRIWKTYLDLDAPRLVTVTDTVLKRTRLRAKYSALYGPDIFAEILLDVVKQFKQGVLVRFLTSSEHTRMINFLTDSDPLPGPLTLEVPPPYRALFRIEDMDILANKQFSCRELVSDSLLYHQFFSYLRLRDCHESLLGVRLLTIFEERVTVKDLDHAEQVAWEIYRYYVAQGSPFEVPIDDMERKEVQRSLGKPRMNTFDPVKRILCITLRTNFEEFKKTETYEGLNALIVDSLKRRRQNDLVIVRGGCGACHGFNL
jgi:hypothetical protein